MKRCECGADREPGAAACARCSWLDGMTPVEARVIAAIRLLGGRATREALSFETELAERTLYRTLAKLRRLRRIVVQRERDDDSARATYVLRTSRLGV